MALPHKTVDALNMFMMDSVSFSIPYSRKNSESHPSFSIRSCKVEENHLIKGCWVNQEYKTI